MRKILFIAVSIVLLLNVNTFGLNRAVPKETALHRNAIPFEIPPLLFGQNFDSVKTLLHNPVFVTFDIVHEKKKKGIIDLESKISISKMSYWFNSDGQLYCVAIFIPKSEAVYSDIRSCLEETYHYREILTEIDQPFLFIKSNSDRSFQCEVESFGKYGEFWQLSITQKEN